MTSVDWSYSSVITFHTFLPSIPTALSSQIALCLKQQTLFYFSLITNSCLFRFLNQLLLTRYHKLQYHFNIFELILSSSNFIFISKQLLDFWVFISNVLCQYDKSFWLFYFIDHLKKVGKKVIETYRNISLPKWNV